MENFIKFKEYTMSVNISYVVYPLGPGHHNILRRATHAEHAGVRLTMQDGSYREVHYAVDGNRVSTYVNRDLGGNTGMHHIAEVPNEKAVEIEARLREEFDRKPYVFGTRDCWSLVERCSHLAGVDKAGIRGPIDDCHGPGNGDCTGGTHEPLRNVRDVVVDCVKNLFRR